MAPLLSSLCFLGGDFFNRLLGRIPQGFVNALSVTGNLLPALGVAMLLNYLGKKKMIPYFVIGFFLTTFLDLGIMAVAILGACVAVIVYYAATEKAEEDLWRLWRSAKQIEIRLRKSDLVKHWLIGLGAEVGYTMKGAGIRQCAGHASCD